MSTDFFKNLYRGTFQLEIFGSSSGESEADIDVMFESMPMPSFNFVAGLASFAAEHIKGIGLAVLPVIGAFGIYKGMLSALHAVEVARNIVGTIGVGIQILKTHQVKAYTKALMSSNAQTATSTILEGTSTGAKVVGTGAQWSFNAALLACPITIVVMGIMAIIGVLVALTSKIGKAKDATDGLSTSLGNLGSGEYDIKTEFKDNPELEKLMAELQKKSDELNKSGSETSTNTGKTAQNTEKATEDTVWIRDYMEQEAISRINSSSIKIDFSGQQNTFNNTSDISGFTDALSEAIIEAVNTGAEGVHK